MIAPITLEIGPSKSEISRLDANLKKYVLVCVISHIMLTSFFILAADLFSIFEYFFEFVDFVTSFFCIAEGTKCFREADFFPNQRVLRDVRGTEVGYTVVLPVLVEDFVDGSFIDKMPMTRDQFEKWNNENKYREENDFPILNYSYYRENEELLELERTKRLEEEEINFHIDELSERQNLNDFLILLDEDEFDSDVVFC